MASVNLTQFLWSPLPRAGSRVILSGAAGGLGQALIEALGEIGAEIVGLDLPHAIDKLPSGHGARFLKVDITDSAAVRDGVTKAADLLGGIDAVIGAAGIVDTIHPAASFPEAAYRRDIDTNLVGQFALAQAAYPHLKDAEAPAIVFVTSVAGLDGLPGQMAYAASKAGLIGLATSLAGEWARDGIRVNAVAPGMFATPKVRALSDATRERMLVGVPMKRVGTLDEVVGPILFLLSPAATYMTGRTLRIDGGTGLTMTGLFH